MKKITIILFLIFLLQSGFSQVNRKADKIFSRFFSKDLFTKSYSLKSKKYTGENLPNNDFNVPRLRVPYKYGYNTLSTSFGWQKFSFLNSTFATNRLNPSFDYRFGSYMALSVMYRPLRFELNHFTARYSYNDNKEDVKAWKFGLYSQVPILNSLHLGAGIMYGNISNPDILVNTTENLQKFNVPYWSINYVGRPIRSTIRLVNPNFYIQNKTLKSIYLALPYFNVQYSQSFSVNNDYAFNQLYVGVTFRPSKYKYIGKRFYYLLREINFDFDFDFDSGFDFFDGSAGYILEDGAMLTSLGYVKTNFLNENYLKNKEAGIITPVGGFEYKIKSMNWFPLIVDFSMFSSEFNIESVNWNFADTVNAHHRGMELAVNLPLFLKFEYFVPYVGVGFNTSSLTNKTIWAANDPKSVNYYETVSINTSSLLWKVGFFTIINETWVFYYEYKHSFLNKNHSFKQFSIGVGFLINNL